MTDQEKQKLNEKMAKWCGFEFCAARDGSLHWFDKEGDIVSPTNDDGSIPFTDSMDACIKWIVPKLKRYTLEWGSTKDGGCYSVIVADGKSQFPSVANTDTLPLAFCLALEKLIESEVKPCI